tara:strand:- start:5056 stop:6174 length:1119 start_codon:yes stop_codon:yes gene_type:complete
MKYVLLFLGMFICTHSLAQITLIPDEEFEQFLILNGIDSDFTINGQVNTADIENLIELEIEQVPITDLTGIEDFTALEVLEISFTDLAFLDVTQNSNLEVLQVVHCNLTSLALTNNPALETLICGNPAEDVGPFNQITSIDLSGAPNLLVFDVAFMGTDIAIDFSEVPVLEEFYGSYCEFTAIELSNNPNLHTLILGGRENGTTFGVSNNFTAIDLSNNPNLETLDVRLTHISSLDLKNGNNAALTTVLADLNPDLMCIQVDDEAAANNGDAPYGSWNIDPQTAYAEECILGIAENELGSFKLYPNPASEIVQITLSNGLMPEEIQVYSVDGLLLLQQSFRNSIDVSSLTSGFYILKAQFNGSFSSKAFLKQ